MNILNYEKAIEFFEYSKVDGILRFKQNIGNKVKAGAIAGYKSRQGYIEIGFKKKHYMAHRLIWLIVHGENPKGEIDHIDGDRSNNKIENLRDVSRIVNQQNQKKAHADSYSGLIGVGYSKISKSWTAQIKHNGKKIYLGIYKNPVDAHNVYLEAKRKLHIGCTI